MSRYLSCGWLVGGFAAALLAVGCSGPTAGGPDTPSGSPTPGPSSSPNPSATPAPGDTDTDDTPAIVKTRIVMNDNTLFMRPKAGDDLIVWGNGSQEGSVYYIFPSETDNETETAIEFPEGPVFQRTSFAVAERNVVLVRSTGEIRVFNVDTGDATDVPASDIVLENPSLSDDRFAGLMTSDGHLVATLNDMSRVADANPLKVIDTEGSVPSIISFPNPDDGFGPVDNWAQVAVDADSRRFAAATDNGLIYVFDVDNPDAAPTVIDLSLNSENPQRGFHERLQMVFDGDYLAYQQWPDTFPLGNGSTNAALLNVNTEEVAVFTNNPTQGDMPVELANGSVGYFVWKEDADLLQTQQANYRSAISSIGSPDSTLAERLNYIEADNPDSGAIGYGSTLAITPDGEHWFISGWGPISISENQTLQVSTGGAYSTIEDPDGDVRFGLLIGTDVTCTRRPASEGMEGVVVAFRTLRVDEEDLASGTGLPDGDWYLGFIRPQLLDQ